MGWLRHDIGTGTITATAEREPTGIYLNTNEKGCKTMKQGFVQLKMSEIDELLKNMKDKSTILEMRLNSIEQKIGAYDILLEKLTNVERFRNEISNSVIKNNEVMLTHYNDKIIKELADCVNIAIGIRMEKINNFLTGINRQAININQFRQRVFNLATIVDKNSWLLAALTKKLVENNILTIQEMQRILGAAERNHKHNLMKKNNKKIS